MVLPRDGRTPLSRSSDERYYRTSSSRMKVVREVGFKPTAFSMSPRYSNQTELHAQKMVVADGFDPSSVAYQATVLATELYDH